MWERLAEPYGEHLGPESVLQVYSVIPAFLRLVGDISGKRVLDLGCGVGGLSLVLAEKAMMVLGIDSSSSMIDQARENTQRMGITNAQFQTMDCRELDMLDAGSFDVVVSAAMFHYIEDLEKAFQNTAQVLRKGGAFIFSTLHPFATACEPRLGLDDGPYEEFDEVNYFDESKRVTLPPWYYLSSSKDPDALPLVEIFHHTLEDYYSSLRAGGFAVDSIDEVKPTPELRKADATLYEFQWKEPMFLAFRAISS